MMKILSFTATSVAMVALQGCKSTTDMSKLTKTAKDSNAKITGDNQKLADFDKPITTFEKDVKKVKEQSKDLKESTKKEWTDLKVKDVCTNLTAMNTQFLKALPAADAKTLFARYTKAVAGQWKFFDYSTTCTTSPGPSKPSVEKLQAQAAEVKSLLVQQQKEELKKAKDEDKDAIKAKFAALIKALDEAGDDVAKLEAAIKNGKAAVPKADLILAKDAANKRIAELEKINTKAAKDAIKVIQAALKKKDVTADEINKAVAAAKDIKKPELTAEQAFEADAQDTDIISKADQDDQDFRFKSLKPEEQDAEYKTMKALVDNKTAKKAKYAELLVAAKKVFTDARKTVVDGLESADFSEEQKNKLTDFFNKKSLKKMNDEVAALKTAQGELKDDALKAANKAYFTAQLETIKKDEDAKKAGDAFLADLKVNLGEDDAQKITEAEQTLLKAEWKAMTVDEKIAREALVAKVRAGEAVTIGTVDYAAVAAGANKQTEINTHLIAVYKAYAAAFKAAEEKKAEIKKMNTAYGVWESKLGADEKKAETARLATRASEDDKLADFRTVVAANADAGATETEVKTAYDNLLTAFVDAKYNAKVATVAPAMTDAEGKLVVDYHWENRDLAGKCADYKVVKDKTDNADVKNWLITLVKPAVEAWHTDKVMSQLTEDEKPVETTRFEALADPAMTTMFNDNHLKVPALLKTDVEALLEPIVTADYNTKRGFAFAAPLTAEAEEVLAARWAARSVEDKCTDYKTFKDFVNTDAATIAVAKTWFDNTAQAYVNQWHVTTFDVANMATAPVADANTAGNAAFVWNANPKQIEEARWASKTAQEKFQEHHDIMDVAVAGDRVAAIDVLKAAGVTAVHDAADAETAIVAGMPAPARAAEEARYGALTVEERLKEHAEVQAANAASAAAINVGNAVDGAVVADHAAQTARWATLSPVQRIAEHKLMEKIEDNVVGQPNAADIKVAEGTAEEVTLVPVADDADVDANVRAAVVQAYAAILALYNA